MSEENSAQTKRSKDSIANVLIVAISLCLVCSVMVSTAAVVLQPIQERNKLLDRKKNILNSAALYDPARDIEEQFQQVETRVVELSSGQFVDHVSARDYDLNSVLKDPSMSKAIADEEDIAKIRRQETYALVYLVKDQDQIKYIILPIRGAGLYSTLYGFLALKADGNTVQGLSFYDQGETPGLGGEIVNPKWRSKWRDKRIYDDTGEPRIELVKGAVDYNQAQAVHQVDAIAGATLTSRGVGNLMRFWFGEQGYKALLERIALPEG
ncbi:MAG: Na(+)-translocating NADH-quinone reductase subunit C [Gammaproteobacteria bacterium]|nr:Na(+)-translocating NADH-quinone reductase subunit C [Gammaproteobacteria bacterium]NNJ97782.1 Na(+)-translocating NADH-quinone reductase subunit C [Gammaproteobacteria bacterium]